MTAGLRLLLASGTVDRGTGRAWVDRELSKAEYSANDLTPLEQLGRWFDSVLTGILSAAMRGNTPWLLLLVLLAVIAVAALIVWRVRRLGLRRARLPLADFDAVVALPHPQPWRESARAAAERGDLRTAVIDQSRAVFAVLAQARVIDLGAAATAAEIARTAGREVPAHAADLTRVAEVFNDLVFGRGSAPDRSEEALRGLYTDFLRLDEELASLPTRERAEVGG